MQDRSEELARLSVLSEQFKTPGLDVGQIIIDLKCLDFIPLEIAQQHLILPVLIRENRMSLVMVNPTERRIIDEVSYITGYKIIPYVAPADILHTTISNAYSCKRDGQPYFIGEHTPQERLLMLGIADPRSSGADTNTSHEIDKAQPLDNIPKSISLDNAFEEQNSLAAASTQTQTNQRKILVVDDENDIRQLLSRLLTQKGYLITEASTGTEALKSVDKDPPDLIILDAMLPEVHGFEICQRIRSSQLHQHIPIIMLSAEYRGWRIAADLRESYGVDIFLEKPFRIQDIITNVEHILTGTTNVTSEDIFSDQAHIILQQAMEAYHQQNFEVAIEKLNQGLQIDPLAFQFHYHLGLLLGKQEKNFDAIHSLERSLDLKPAHFAALKNLAVLYQKIGFKHKAIEVWERALNHAPDEETEQGIKDLLMSLFS